MDVWRDGKLVRIDATLADAAEKPRRAQAEDVGNAVDNSARLGLSLRPLEPIERRQSGIAAGLLIEDAVGRRRDRGRAAGRRAHCRSMAGR